MFLMWAKKRYLVILIQGSHGLYQQTIVLIALWVLVGFDWAKGANTFSEEYSEIFTKSFGKHW